MKLLAGKTFADEGEVFIDGKKVSPPFAPPGVRYLETAGRQFNMTIDGLISLSRELDPAFDADFAREAARRFGLDGKQKYHAFSLGMKAMATVLLSLAGGCGALLLDEPVLGMDAVTRTAFYRLLSDSMEARPRVILVSTHLIDEIRNTAERLLFLRDGKLILNESLDAVLERAYKVTGLERDVDEGTAGLNVIGSERIGKFKAAYVYDERRAEGARLTIERLSPETFFVAMAGGYEDETIFRGC